MPTAAAVAVGTLPASAAATVDLTVPSFGEPTAALIFTNYCPAGASWTINGLLSAGLWAANGQGAVGYAETGGGTSGTGSRANSGLVSLLPYWAGNSGDVASASAAVITGGNGIRLTGVVGNARSVSALLLKGTTNAYVGTVNLGTGTTEITENNAGFQPDVIIFLSTGYAFSTLAVDHASICFGAAHRDSTGVVSQCTFAFSDTDNLASIALRTYINNTKALARVGYNDVLSWTVSVTSWNSTGFGITPSASTTGADVVYLALKLADPDDAAIGIIHPSLKDGVVEHTELGFTPSAICFVHGWFTAPIQMLSGPVAFGVGDATTERTLGTFEPDGIGYGEPKSSASSSNIISLVNGVGPTYDTEASVDSFFSDGFRLNYSNGSGAQRHFMMLAFGDSTAAGSGEIKPTRTLSSPTYAPGSISNTGVTPRVTQTNTGT